MKTMNFWINFKERQMRYQSINSTISQNALRFPDKPAIKYGEQTVSYLQLEEQSNRIANLLHDGVKENRNVMIMLDRSPRLIEVIVGVLKAGLVFVPINPLFPANRIRAMFRETPADWVVTSVEYYEKSREIIDTGENPPNVLLIDGNEGKNRLTSTAAELAFDPIYNKHCYIYFTSGSSGTPKGVLGRQQSLVHFIQWEINEFNINENFNVSQLINPSFDPFLRDVFVPLMAGGASCIPDNDTLMNPVRLLKWLDRNRITLMHTVLSMFRVLVTAIESPDCLSHLKYITLSGELLRGHDIKPFIKIFGNRIELINSYGPTETTLAKFFYRIKTGDREKTIIPVGKPIDGAQALILNQNMKKCLKGNTGEIYIRTPFISSGYFNDPALTRERFIKNPFSDNPRDIIYKSGDIGKVLPDGNIELVGRTDQQVKIRGIRIELGEIEHWLLAHASISDAVVVVAAIKSSAESHLFAFIVSGEEIPAKELKKHLAQYLPEYMIPGYFVRLEKIPLTPNGKKDRGALPFPKVTRQKEYVAPRDGTEDILVRIWADVLGMKKEMIGIEDDFFEIGGHSLSLMSMIAAIYKQLEVRIPLGDIFKRTTIKKISRYIKGAKKETYIAIPPVEKKKYYRMTSAQKRLYFLQQKNPGSTFYNMTKVITLQGEIDTSRLENTLKKLLERHEVLRTSFKMVDNEPRQEIHHAGDMEFKLEQSRDSGAAGEIEEIIRGFVKPFDLSRPPLLRAGYVKTREKKEVLMFTIHHIVTDAQSQDVLAQEFQELYAGKELPDLPLQCKDYAEWQNSNEYKATINKQETYWLETLSGELPTLQLPTDYPRPPLQSYEGANIDFTFSPGETRAFKEIARHNDVTLYVLTLAVFNLLFARLSGREDIIIGVPITVRHHTQLEKMIGMFVNVLPNRNYPNAAKTFQGFLKEVEKNLVNALKNREYQLEDLVEKILKKRDPSRNPLFDVVLNFINRAHHSPGTDGLNESDVYKFKSTTSQFDLNIAVVDFDDMIFFNINYCTRIFKPATIKRFIKYFHTIVHFLSGSRNPRLAEIEIISEAERKSLYSRIPGVKIPSLPGQKQAQLPVSYHQERLWFIDKFEAGYLYPSSPVYHNIPLILKIEGPLDIAALEQSIRCVINRHGALRTRVITTNNKPLQLIDPNVDFQLPVKDVEDDAVAQALQEAQSPFLMSKDPLIRAKLLRKENQPCILVVTLHHIIADRASMVILAREILVSYAAAREKHTGALPPLPIQYSHFTRWQRELPPEMNEYWLSYWKRELQGKLQPLKLPTDKPRASVHTYQGKGQTFSFKEAFSQKLTLFSQTNRFPVRVILLAAFKVLLYRFANHDEIVVGTSFKNRDMQGIEGVIGPIANLAVLRSHLSGSPSFETLLAILDRKLKLARKYQGMPFDKLVSELNPHKDMSRTALFDVLFQYEEAPLQLPHLENISVDIVETNFGWGKYDLNLLIIKEENSFTGILVYNGDYYNHSTILRMMANYMTILENVVDKPGTRISNCPMLTAEETQEILHKLNDTGADYPKDETLHHLFHKQAQKNPHNIAVDFEEESLTYNQLKRKSTQLALLLKENGVKADTLVAMVLDPSPGMLIGIMGILESGGAYLPMDPDYPRERIRCILSDSGAKIVVTNRELADKVDSLKDWQGKTIFMETTGLAAANPFTFPSLHKAKTHDSWDSLPQEAAPQEQELSPLAYVIYTSGTTGLPKGAMIEHRNVVQLLLNSKFPFDFSDNDTWTLFHSYCFDFSVWEIFGALLYGSRLVVIPRKAARNPEKYLEVLKRRGVTVLNQTPAAFYNLANVELSTTDKRLHLRYIIFGGEALHPFKLKSWQQKYPETKLINMYGITETTVHVTFKEITANDIEQNTCNIGGPLATLAAYVMDRNLQLLPIGVPGELCVGGDGVCRGYLGKPQLTRQKFVENPYREGDILYRSGDLVKLAETGDLEYLGRIDNQVKIRGYRIEPGEIRAQLKTHQDITEAAVTVKEKEGTGICAYIVSGKKLDLLELRGFLAQKLPDYMIPAYFVQLEAMPLTPNGKIDLAALPARAEMEMDSGVQYIKPRNEIEEKLVRIWEEVLDRERIGIEDNFFTIGGDSIKTIQIMARMRKEGYKIQLTDIFTNPTISLLSPQVTRLKQITDQSPVSGLVPLTPIQQWFFQNHGENPHHFNQSIMLQTQERIPEKTLREIFEKLQEHHDGLRITYRIGEGKVTQYNNGKEHPLSLEIQDLTRHPRPGAALEDAVERIQRSINLETGPLMKLGLFHLEDGDRLLIVIHHLVTDGVSWRILFEDLDTLYMQSRDKEPFELPPKTDSFKQWAEKLANYANTREFLEEKNYWAGVEAGNAPPIPGDFENGRNFPEDRETFSFRLNEAETRQLITEVHKPFNTEINDLLLAALALAFRKTFGIDKLLITLEGHGREHIAENIDISRTIGWFTTMYPVLLDITHENRLDRHIIGTKETLRKVPNRGIGWGVLKYMTAEEHKKEIRFESTPALLFNYLGQFDREVEAMTGFKMAKESPGKNRGNNEQNEYPFKILGIISQHRLSLSINYSSKQYRRQTIETLLGQYKQGLKEIISYCISPREKELTPSDLTYKQIPYETLEKLKARYPVEDIYPLTPLQEGMLFHALYDRTATAYFQQVSYWIHGDLNITCMEKSLDELCERHDILRTAFIQGYTQRPIQVVLKNRRAELHYEDIEARVRESGNDIEQWIDEFKKNDRSRLFDLAADPLMRVSVLKLNSNKYQLIWSHHHIILDGWSVVILVSEFLKIYNNSRENRQTRLGKVTPYREYINWLGKQDQNKSRQYWLSYLHDYNTPAGIPKIGTVHPTAREYINETIKFQLKSDEKRKLTEFAERSQVTLNTVMQSVWGIILEKYNGKGKVDVVFGNIVSGRPAEIKGLETMVGLFLNTIPVRVTAEPDLTCKEMIQNVQQSALESEPHHHYPLSQIQAQHPLKQALIDHLLVFENYPTSDRLDQFIDNDHQNTLSMEFSNRENCGQIHYDLNIIIIPADPFVVTLRYNANVYEKRQIEKVSQQFYRALTWLLDNNHATVADLKRLSAAGKREIEDFNENLEYM
jgi:iturin family lipopeptide synthetase B